MPEAIATFPASPGTHPDDLFFQTRKSIRPLKTIIVGAGIAGLTLGVGLARTGHSVTILEQVPVLTEIGAGIQIAPNAARVMRRFGLLDEVMEWGTVLEGLNIRKYKSDEKIGTVSFKNIEARYRAPWGMVHRGDLQRILVDAAKTSGVQIITSQKVVEAITTTLGAEVRTTDGTCYHGDVVFAADGIKSGIRAQIAAANGVEDRTIPTGDAAYRLMIPRKAVENDAEVLSLLNQDVLNRYLGPGGHTVVYPLRKHTLYNMVLIYPSSSTTLTESWTRRGDKTEMLHTYRNWSPLIRKLLSYVPEGEVIQWALNSHEPLPHWVEGNVALVGDACHPMLPYVAQGGANAIEDAGVIVAAFTCTDNVQLALGVYETVRKERGERIQASAAKVRRDLHLEDGPEQQRRDEAMRKALNGEGDNSDLLADRKWQEYMWGVDVMRDTVENWKKLAVQIQREKETKSGERRLRLTDIHTP